MTSRASARGVRAALLAAFCVGVLAACSPTTPLVVVRMADGYHVASPNCQGYVTLEVSNWDDSADDVSGSPWKARTASGQERLLPVDGVAIAPQASEWVADTPNGLGLAPGGVVRVQATPRDAGDFDATKFDLTLEVGQYRDANGNVGDWSSYIAERTPC